MPTVYMGASSIYAAVKGVAFQDGTVQTTAAVTSTIATIGSLDGLAVTSTLATTTLSTPTTSGMYLVSFYSIINAASAGDGSDSSTMGPVTIGYTDADSATPIALTAGLLLGDGVFSTVNNSNSTATSHSGSVIVNAAANDPITLTIDYASTGTTPYLNATATLSSALWDGALIDLVGTPVYVGSTSTNSNGSVTSIVTPYVPTPGNCAVVMFSTGGAVTTLTCEDNHGNALIAGPTEGTLALFHQASVPAATTAYTLSWGTARDASVAVLQYSGVTSVLTTLTGNVNTSTGVTATVSATGTSVSDVAVVGFGSTAQITFGASVGTQRQNIAGNSGTNALIAMDNSAASPMSYNYHARAVFIGGS